jgi:DNA primase
LPIPPEFLEEIRRRLTLSSVVGKRVRLTKKGREHSGLCPFHNEKTPSFTVNDDKAFYHCFGCGAHGDVLSFVINTEGLSFPEAVERLAGEAGLEVPRTVALDPAEKARRAGAEAAVEAACAWFQSQLRLPAGKAAFDYLRGRGVDEIALASFRIGFAPDLRTALKAHLLKQDFAEDVLLEAGLLVKPEDGGASYDRFRGRVMFPIADRRGRVIAFGGRVLGDGQPKYLNSPEGPLFHKGRTLYAHHLAREAAAQSEPVIVAEGYMDVVALHRAGFHGAVAPLGTALTEDQLAELWRLAPEPVLCFDGDAAGQRAAARAAVRALPLLAPGKSLRFVTLPGGQDPDDLVRQPGGSVQFRDLLAGAAPLSEVLWATEVARLPLDTPERRADMRVRLRDHINHIGDRDVRRFYAEDFAAREARLFEFGSRRPTASPRGGRAWRGGRPPEPYERLRKDRPSGLRQSAAMIERLEALALLASVVTYPELIEEFHEALAAISFMDEALDRLRAEIVHTLAAGPGLDAAGLQNHLAERGFSVTLATVLRPDVYSHVRHGRHNVSPGDAREWLEGMLAHRLSRLPPEELIAAQQRATEAQTPEAWAQFRALLQQREEAEAAADDAFDLGRRKRP